MKNYLMLLCAVFSVLLPSLGLAAPPLNKEGLLVKELSATPASPIAGQKKVYPKSDGKLYTLNSAGVEVAVGAGSSGGINYLSANPDAETTIAPWVTSHNTAASAIPDTGFVAGTTTTWARTTVSPLRGVGSFLVTKDAANRQGEHADYAFTIDQADQGQVLSIQADYTVASGTYADGDLNVWIWDPVNNVAIQPAGFKILNTTAQLKIAATFQTATNSNLYKLIVFVASTSASAYSVKFDNWYVGPQLKSYGPFISDRVAYVPTITNFGTTTSVAFYSKRVGDELYVWGTFIAGTGVASLGTITLGYNGANNNVTGDTTKIASGTHLVGHGAVSASSAAFFGVDVLYNSATNALNLSQQTSSSNGLTAVNGSSFSAGSEVDFFAQVPIVGWSSGQLLSSDADTRVVAARFTKNGNQTTAAADNIITAWSVDYDTNGGLTGGNTYTVQVPGYYRIALFAQIGATSAVAGYKINGGATSYMGTGAASTTTFDRASGSDVRKLGAGDVITPVLFTSGAVSILAPTTTFSIERLSGPSQIAASESVNARYGGSTTTLTNSATSKIAFTTKQSDSHNAFSTDTFTVPTPGKYRVTMSIELASFAAGAAGNTLQGTIFKNGSQYSQKTESAKTTTSVIHSVLVTDTIPCVAGDTLDGRIFHTLGATPAINNSVVTSYITFERVGN